MVAKGAESGGCCCGGCRSKPYDPALATTAYQPVTARCCTCIPKAICATAKTLGGDTMLVRSMFSTCDGTLDTAGEPIIYTGDFDIYGVQGTLVIRFVTNDIDYLCSLKYEIVALGVSGTTLIDHTDPSSTECDGQHSRQCCEFIFSWTVPATTHGASFTLSLAPSDTLVVSEATKCAGCGCICRDVCFGVYSRTSADFTYRGSSELITGLHVDRTATGCDGGPTIIYGTDTTWTRSDGWVVKIPGVIELSPSSRVIHAGTESSLICDITRLLWLTDGNSHLVSDSESSVEYIFAAGEQIANGVKWVGTLTGADSSAEFFAWNWDTSAWVSLGEITGRDDWGDALKAFESDLAAVYTDTDPLNLGKVKIRIDTTGATTISGDMLRIQLVRCCVLELVPPGGVGITSTSQPMRRPLVYPDACPNPSFFWEFTDGTTDYLVDWGCAWCDGQCGGTLTTCCDRPIPRVLTASVEFDCTLCSAENITLFQEPAGSIWQGTAVICGETVTVILSCGGDGWKIDVRGLGSCQYIAFADTTVCDPIQFDWEGTYSAGLACCGPADSPFITSTPITVRVTE